MYEDGLTAGNNALKHLKAKMTLDFNGQSKSKKVSNLLASPDLNICTLASPELERIIIQQNGMVTTTPTPTQFLFPKSVSEEQEAYARGFVDALAELHKTGNPMDDEMKSEDGTPALSAAQMTTMTTLQPVQAMTAGTTAMSVAQSQHLSQAQQSSAITTGGYNYTTTTSLPAISQAPMPTVVSSQQPEIMMDLSRTSSPALMQQHPPTHHRVMQLKEEPQMVPNCNSPPMSPINMEVQEAVKLDRKRARNRVAARKCRFRKLERISKLEDRVKELTGQKNELAANASQLKDQVARLKQQIMEHVNSGCKVMLNSNLL